MAPSLTFRAARPHLVGRVLPAYQRLGDLVALYAQGSLVERLADSGDLDVVAVWADQAPTADRRPPAGIADDQPPPQVFEHDTFILDRIFITGQQFDIKHVTVAELESWAAAAEAGEGTQGYPMPVVSIHGFLAADVVFDPAGVAARYRDRLKVPPAALVEATVRRALDDGPGHRRELEAAEARGDGLLFHALAVEWVRLVCMAWFSSTGLWWPHEKRLGERLRRAGRDDLADLEAAVWTAGANLGARLAAIDQLAEAVLAEIRCR